MAKSRLVGEAVPMLINGVSQQSEVLRLPSQVTEQINCISSLVSGVSKRPPTEFIKQLATNEDWSDAKVHTINRDDNEKYFVVIQDDSIRVFDPDGLEHNVNRDAVPTGGYLDIEEGKKPRDEFRAHTIADTTFIVNRTKIVEMNNDLKSSKTNYKALVWIKSQKELASHRIQITSPSNNFTVAFEQAEAARIDLNHAASKLAERLNEAFVAASVQDTWKAGTYTNIILIESDDEDFAITVGNDWSDTYISVIKDEVTGVAELTSRAVPGMQVKITGNADDPDEGFWVKFVADGEKILSFNSDGHQEVTVPGTSFSTDESGEITITGHPFMSRKVQISEGSSTASGGEREAVQFLEGEVNWNDGVAAVLDTNKVYFVEVKDANTILLASSPSAGGYSFQTQAEIALAYPAITGGDGVTYDSPGTADDHVPATLVRLSLVPGKWIEDIEPDISYRFKYDTLPHVLIRTNVQDETDGTYQFQFLPADGRTYPVYDGTNEVLKWADRLVGDETSAPEPSFIGNTINDVFEWRESLGFISRQNFILSERAYYNNFWPTTVATSLDDARIDVAASGSHMSDFHSVRIFQDELVGFTNDGQFSLSSSDTTLTPMSVMVTETTKYESSSTAQPVNLGSSLAFPTSRGEFSGISEYFIQRDQMAYVMENTRHIEHYIEGEVTQLSVSAITDSLIVLSDKPDLKTLYFYSWFWKGDEKIQSSWSKWTFGSDVLSAHFFKDVLYLIMQADEGQKNPELYKIVLTAGAKDTDSDYKTSLDRRVELSGTDISTATLTLPYTIESGTISAVDSSGKVLTIDSLSGSSVVLSDIPSESKVYVGEVYNSELELSRPVAKSGAEGAPDLQSRLQVQDFILHHDNSGYYKVKVYPKEYTTTPYEYEMDNLLGGITLNTSNFNSGTLKVPVRANAKDMRLVIHNDSHIPHHIISSEWTAHYSPKAYRGYGR